MLPVACGALVLAGCAGPLGLDDTSASIGTHAYGALRRPAALPLDGDGYTVPTPWRGRRSNYATDELVRAIVRAARVVERTQAGGQAAIGDLSRRGGGASIEHRSHQNGRDVDIFYYAIDRDGRSARPGEAMVRYAADGRAVRWSPAHGQRPPSRPVPTYRFDARRNWAFVRSLLSDPDVEVQWIFMHRALGALLIRDAAEQGEDPALLARAAFIIHHPSDAEPHDDHMHVRVYCDPSDRTVGCVDRGPVRWWKKLWKYMAPPFGNGSDPRSLRAVQALASAIRGELPAVFAGGVPTS